MRRMRPGAIPHRAGVRTAQAKEAARRTARRARRNFIRARVTEPGDEDDMPLFSRTRTPPVTIN